MPSLLIISSLTIGALSCGALVRCIRANPDTSGAPELPSIQREPVTLARGVRPSYSRVLRIKGYNFDHVMRRVARQYPEWSHEALKAAREGLKDYLILHLVLPEGARALPSRLVRAALEVFQADEIAFREFCKHILGIPVLSVDLLGQLGGTGPMVTGSYSPEMQATMLAAMHCHRAIQMEGAVPMLFLLDKKHLPEDGVHWNVSDIEALKAQVTPLPYVEQVA